MMKSCCCCLSLRQGTLASAIYAIILSLVVIIFGAVMIAVLNGQEEQHLNQRSFGSLFGREAIKDIYDSQRLIYYVVIGVYVAWLVTAVIMIIAVKQRIRCLLLPWVIFTCILLGLMGWSLINQFTKIGAVFNTVYGAIQFILATVMFVIDLYCIICVAVYFRAMPLEDDAEPVRVGYKA